MEVQELRIDAPWGHLAAKAWGDPSNPMVLAFHGISDNAGSFDSLIPLLPDHFYYVCFDLPGHGRSSHFPSPFPLHVADYALVYLFIAQHFQRQKYIIMGHSLGGQIATLFAQLYPEFVEKIILLDAVYVIPTPISLWKRSLRSAIDYTIELDEKKNTSSRPTYSFEEILKKVRETRWLSRLSDRNAQALLERGLKKEEDGRFSLTSDSRLKHVLNPLHDSSYQVQSLKKAPIECPMLILLAKQNEVLPALMKTVLDFYREQKNVVVEFVDAPHDLQMTNPEEVASHVIRFLSRKSKL